MADYALLVTHHLANKMDILCTTDNLAQASQLSLPTVRKILKMLVDADIVTSYRGVKGGYKLSRDARLLSVADIITAVEGPIAITECSQAHHDCELEEHCELKHNWSYINNMVAQFFKHISLADLANPNTTQIVGLNPSSTRTSSRSVVFKPF